MKPARAWARATHWAAARSRSVAVAPNVAIGAGLSCPSSSHNRIRAAHCSSSPMRRSVNPCS